jgi:hypothetical protein
MEVERVVLSNVEKLDFDGGGKLNVNTDGSLHLSPGVKVEQKGKCIIFSGGRGSNGGTIIMGDGNSMVSVGNGNVIIGSSGGKRIEIRNGQVQEPEEPRTAAEPTKNYIFSEDVLIKSVQVTGSFSVSFSSSRFLHLALFSASVKGSGDIFLPPAVFENLTVNVAGSGDICGVGGNKTAAVNGSIVVAGSGDVNKIHLLLSGSVTVAGSGDVSVTKAPDAKVIKNSGDIRIKIIE